jgi:hypothetical protein
VLQAIWVCGDRCTHPRYKQLRVGLVGELHELVMNE